MHETRSLVNVHHTANQWTTAAHHQPEYITILLSVQLPEAHMAIS